MKNKLKLLLLGSLASLSLSAPLLHAEERLIDNLGVSKVGQLPTGWKYFPFQGGKAKEVYQVAQEAGVNFIKAKDDKNISTPIYREFVWKIAETPNLSWRWRAQTLPAGAKENNKATNDSACGVYVAFGKTSGVGIKYVWSSTLPVGHVWEKEPGKFFIIVKASGQGSAGKWQYEKVNVAEDFKKYFKKDPSKDPTGIGILTDGNAVNAAAACDYGSFKLSS